MPETLNPSEFFLASPIEEIKNRMIGPGNGPSYERSWIIQRMEDNIRYSTSDAAGLLKDLGIDPRPRCIDSLGKFTKFLEPSADRKWLGSHWKDRHSQRGVLRGFLTQIILCQGFYSPSELFSSPQSWQFDQTLILKLRVETRRVGFTQRTTPLPPPKRRGKIKMMVGLTFMVLLSAATLHIQPNRVYEVYRTKGPAAASEYATKMAIGRDNGISLYFATAWVDYANGDYERARKKAADVLKQSPGSYARANCHYLLGSLERKEGDDHSAFFHFNQARVLYTGIENMENQFNTTLQLARIQMNFNELEKTGELLDAAMESYAIHETGNMDYYYAMATKYYIRVGKYPQALEMAQQRLDAYVDPEENQTGYADALSSLGFMHMLMGNFNRGDELTQRSEIIAVEQKNKQLYVHNLINKILAYRCRGLTPTKETVRIIKGRIQAHPESELLWFLNFALEHQCG